VREFKESAGRAECEAITRRLEDTLLAGHHTATPTPQFDLHTRWLATLEGAVAAIKEADQFGGPRHDDKDEPTRR
jgi:hypothetical protein